MSAGYEQVGAVGTYLISWKQVEIDGRCAPDIAALQIGARWRWSGAALPVGEPREMPETWRQRLAHKLNGLPEEDLQMLTGLRNSSFCLTNGLERFTVTVVERAAQPVLVFHDQIPPVDTWLWVERVHMVAAVAAKEVICFTPGTWIRTPGGARLVEDLRAGDLVSTRDNGAQPILWRGSRHISGARLHVMPELRPIRIRAGALGIERPEEELLVSPAHRLLLTGAKMQALFNTSEALVAARDLVDGHSIVVEQGLRQLRYIHLLFEQHQLIWANGVESESFHPEDADLEMLSQKDRSGLTEVLPARYGGHVRRVLNQGQAALLAHAA